MDSTSRRGSRLVTTAVWVALAGLLVASTAPTQEPGKSKDDSVDRLKRSLRSAAKRTADSQRLTEQEMTRQLLDGIKKLQSEGKLEAASRQAADVAARTPNPATQAASRLADTTNQLNASRQSQQEQQRGVAGALAQADKATIIPKGDVEYPKDWKARTAKRSSGEVPTTAKEQSLLRALNSTISLKFTNSRFQDVIDYIQDRIGQTIVLDKTALDEIGVTYDSPVTLNLKEVTVRTGLHKILGDLGLTYVIKDEVIQVVSPTQAAHMMRTQVYYVGELATNVFQAAALIELVQSTVAPESWVANGGTGTIAYDPVRHALIIKQSAEFHPVLASALR
ncbi:MAG TPA: hypothetical protein VK395_17245 [Gemmataceae bacterium]|nr:hypothetical protein [Gemmataceae bacterium]